jgi:RimJ/RimL family protein N-acetyltransferase
MAAPTLETPRLFLRPWRDADVEPWVAMGADPDVMRYFPSTDDRARCEKAAAYMRTGLERRGYGWWVADVKGGAAFAGVMALQTVPFETAFTPAFEIGWRLARAHWGKGYATEAARTLLRFAFEDLEKDEVVAMTAQLNIPSQRVMQRLGMTYDPRDDFEFPFVEIGHALRPWVLYRMRRPG